MGGSLCLAPCLLMKGLVKSLFFVNLSKFGCQFHAPKSGYWSQKHPVLPTVYHQKLKTRVTWLKTIGYDRVLKSVVNVTKAAMHLPKYPWHKFYRDFKIINFNKREMNLEIFEDWLGEWIYNMNNPPSLNVETEIKKNNKPIKISENNKRQIPEIPKWSL